MVEEPINNLQEQHPSVNGREIPQDVKEALYKQLNEIAFTGDDDSSSSMDDSNLDFTLSHASTKRNEQSVHGESKEASIMLMKQENNAAPIDAGLW